MPSICQNIGQEPETARYRWVALWGAALLLSGCAPLPPAPPSTSTAAVVPSAAPSTAANQVNPAADAGNARPGRWGWWRHDRAGAEALAKVAPKPAPLSDQPDPAAQLAPEARDSDQKGIASWYGPGLHGRRTANGERFDSGALTAAHPSLAFGTRVCVRSAATGKTVVVRINDRGPFVKNRVIDLSQAAAEELGMMGLGIKPVELWALADDEVQCPGDELDEDSDVAIDGLSEAARAALQAHRETVSSKPVVQSKPQKK
ncbi:septal ring lytic transglycosylase RlpA family protein [Comamonas sp. GB3 AK4-5]|uniref:septal ring lytic transglycosylase RlpA family protein n=1 Tax=Comamonas sp. GB3 AK4-5 TaxID=3231487 RepID=UPI00351F0E4A